MDDVERLTISEDLRRLMARYVYQADHQRWPDLAALFAPDATFTPHNVDGSVARRMAGREEIAASIAMEDLITRPASTDNSGQARFTAMHGYGHYRLRFTRADGRWYIAELVLTRLRLDFTY